MPLQSVQPSIWRLIQSFCSCLNEINDQSIVHYGGLYLKHGLMHILDARLDMVIFLTLQQAGRAFGPYTGLTSKQLGQVETLMGKAPS